MKSVLINQLRIVYRRLRDELSAEIEATADDEQREALTQQLKRLRTYNNCREMSSTLELVRGELFAPDLAQQLDANPDILNVGNGVLLLKTGELDLHRPEYLCSKIAETDFMVSAFYPGLTIESLLDFSDSASEICCRFAAFFF